MRDTLQKPSDLKMRKLLIEFGWKLAAGILVPFAIAALYLYCDRYLDYLGIRPPAGLHGFVDLAAFAVSIVVGAAFIWKLPASTDARVTTLGVYVPAIGFALIYFSVMFSYAFLEWPDRP
jgi:hypothetical protein